MGLLLYYTVTVYKIIMKRLMKIKCVFCNSLVSLGSTNNRFSVKLNGLSN